MAAKARLALDKGLLGSDGRVPLLQGSPGIVAPFRLLAEDLADVGKDNLTPAEKATLKTLTRQLKGEVSE